MSMLRIGWLLTRPARGGRAALLLPIAAFAVMTTLLLTVLAGAAVFSSWHGQAAAGYQLLAAIALALVLVPLVGLGGGAARLSARRRDDRLATLRLLGASTRAVAALTVAESAVLALAGAVVGVAGYAVLVPAVGLIPFRGAPLTASALWLPPLAVAAVVVAVAAIAAASALLGLRRVVISPLGVRTRQLPPRPHWTRLAVGAALIVGVVVVLQAAPSLGGITVMIVVLGAGFACAAAVLNLVGPFALALLARGQARRARDAVRLIAARTVLESPKAAWRQVGGVAMVSFTAVFAGIGVALAGAAGNSSSIGSADRMLFADIRTGVLITVIASFLLVACSVGVSQAAAILESRDLYTGLDRIGMPARTMDEARRRAVMSPLLAVTLGSAVCAVITVLPLAGITLILAPLSLATILGCLLAGVLIVRVALLATRPVLTAVLRH